MRNHVVGIAAAAAVLLLVPGCAGTSTSATGASVPAAAVTDTASEPAASQPEATGARPTVDPVQPAGQKPPAEAEADAGAAGAAECPNAATLQAVAKLDTGYRIDASTIDCWKKWAVAGAKAPTVAEQGDGLMLFRYTAATGQWKKTSEGSSFDCAADLALTPGAKHPTWCTFA
jgi:hypothetical protein